MTPIQTLLARAAEALAMTMRLAPQRTHRHLRRAIAAIADAQRDLDAEVEA